MYIRVIFSLILGLLISCGGGTGSSSNDNDSSDRSEESIITPSISLIGSSTIELQLGQEYIEPGWTVTDRTTGQLISGMTVEASSDIDVWLPGEYQVTYILDDLEVPLHTATRTIRPLHYYCRWHH